jgi:hypothetical protein
MICVIIRSVRPLATVSYEATLLNCCCRSVNGLSIHRVKSIWKQERVRWEVQDHCKVAYVGTERQPCRSRGGNGGCSRALIQLAVGALWRINSSCYPNFILSFNQGTVVVNTRYVQYVYGFMLHILHSDITLSRNRQKP